jgi:CHASE1-domain containing sensor protein
MRRSLLKLFIVGALASWAAPGLAKSNSQQQRMDYATTADGFFYLLSRRPAVGDEAIGLLRWFC